MQISDDLYLGPVNTNIGTLASSTSLASAVVVAGGSSYAVGDTIALNGAGVPAILTVATISAGAILTVTVTSAGAYTNPIPGTVATTTQTGSGSGATFTPTYNTATNNLPSPMPNGIGPVGRVYVYDVVPAAPQAAGLVASVTPTLNQVLTLTSATAGLIVSLVASLTGSGTVSSVDLRGFLYLVASISGSSDVAVTAGALAWVTAALEGGGDITNATPYATGTLSANIKSYGDLTPEGLRDAVWNSIAASYNTTGTMGQKLNSAASGGIDYHSLGLAVWDMLKSDVVTPESMGEQLKSALTTGKFLALK